VSPDRVRLDPRHPANARVVEYFRTLAPHARPLIRSTDAQDPYYQAGAHLDVVEFLWDTLGGSLPTNDAEARWIRTLFERFKTPASPT
jgi:hypothetical protein